MDMTEGQTVKLIEWLKEHGHSDSQIVDCIAYINKKESKKRVTRLEPRHTLRKNQRRAQSLTSAASHPYYNT